MSSNLNNKPINNGECCHALRDMSYNFITELYYLRPGSTLLIWGVSAFKVHADEGVSRVFRHMSYTQWHNIEIICERTYIEETKKREQKQ